MVVLNEQFYSVDFHQKYIKATVAMELSISRLYVTRSKGKFKGDDFAVQGCLKDLLCYSCLVS